MIKKLTGVIAGLILGGLLFAPVFSIGQEGIPISAVQIITSDELNFVDTIFDGVRHRLAVDANISSVNVPNGRDPTPDNYFRINDTGAEGDTITVSIKGTANDPSTPDDDVPDYTKVFTTQAGEVGDERALRDRIISELNADTNFQDVSFLRAQKVKDRRIVYIYSSKFTLVGEFYARPNANDFLITTTGSASIFQPDTFLVSRVKETSLTRDPDNPHLLGRQGFFGDVSVQAGEIADLFIGNAENGGSPDLRVNGSVTPVDFTIPCDATRDIFIRELRFYAGCNGLKFAQHLCTGGFLTNGVRVEIQSDEQVAVLPLIKSTEDYKNKFALGSGANFRFDDVAGTDQMLAVLTLAAPFPIRVCGTYPTDDQVEVKIQDDLSSGIASFEFIGFGFYKEPQ